MGLCLDRNDDERLGDFAVEVRRESFWLRGPFEVFTGDNGANLLLADIPKIRVALDLVEHHAKAEGRTP